jgi:hypothetical protein
MVEVDDFDFDENREEKNYCESVFDAGQVGTED